MTPLEWFHKYLPLLEDLAHSSDNPLEHQALEDAREVLASGGKDYDIRTLAKVLHGARMKECWGHWDNRQPWPDKLPGDFGYIPQPWVDIAWAQAKAVIEIKASQSGGGV